MFAGIPTAPSELAKSVRSARRAARRARGTRLPIGQRRFLKATARGTSRTHTRWDVPQPSWDRVRQIRKDIQALQVELDRELDLLEGHGDSG
jgi:hypothetical protein